MSARCFALGALAALAFAPLRADITLPVPTAPGSDVTIKLSTPAASLPRFGFAPVRVSIENAAAQERSWQVSFQAGMRNQYPGLATSGRTITVPAGQTRDTWIFVPLAEPSVNAARIMPAGSPGSPVTSGTSSSPFTQVKITKTSTGTKVTRVMSSPMGGAPMISTETEINATTGVLTETTVSRGGSTNTRTSQPQPGADITYTIDPVTGFVSYNTTVNSASALGSIATGSGPHSVKIITSSSPGRATSSLVGSNPPAGTAIIRGSTGAGNPATKVTITDTPTGTKITRVTPIGSAGAMTQEQAINVTTGEMTTMTTTPSGTAMPPRTIQLTRPGMDTTVTIDPTTGSFNARSTSSGNPSAPPKITIIKGPVSGVGPGASGSSAPSVLTQLQQLGGLRNASH